MIKKIFAIVVTVMLCLSMAVSASAYTDTYIYDSDFKLTASEFRLKIRTVDKVIGDRNVHSVDHEAVGKTELPKSASGGCEGYLFTLKRKLCAKYLIHKAFKASVLGLASALGEPNGLVSVRYKLTVGVYSLFSEGMRYA